MRKVEIVAYADGGMEILLGGAGLKFTAEEWRRLFEAIPSKVTIEEKRPMFALFGTKVEVHFVPTPALGGGA